MSTSKRLIVLLVCAILIGVGLYMRGKQRKAGSYVETVGTITWFVVISESDIKGPMHRPQIVYTYEVDGKAYTSLRYAYSQTIYGSARKPKILSQDILLERHARSTTTRQNRGIVCWSRRKHGCR